jgi:hypothetical protein
MRISKPVIAAIAALCAGFSAPSQAASWLEQGIYLTGPRYDGAIPGCEAGLPWVSSNFADKEGQFWNSDLRIVDYDKVREIAYRPWAADTIPRRFCTAKALISDGHWRTVNYSIGEDTGLLGATWGVNFCVVGLDRNWAYNPRCKMARP